MSRYRNRRKRTNQGSLFRGMVRRHWIVSVILFGVSYVGLTYIGEVFPANNKELDELLAALIIGVKGLAAVFFTLTAAGSVAYHYKRKRLIKNLRESNNLIKTLSDMDWREFELLVGQVFRERGYSVLEGEGVKDGGVDLTLRKRGKTYLVQCKHWKGNVGVSVVRELFGVMSMVGAHHAYVVCSGQFTKDASEFANKVGISLIGIEQLKPRLKP